MNQSASGITLIEVLLTLLILAVGLLGLASMQALALRQHQQAFQSALAANVAGNQLESLRVNRQQGEQSPGAGHLPLPNARLSLSMDQQGIAHLQLRWSHDASTPVQEWRLRGRP